MVLSKQTTDLCFVEQIQFIFNFLCGEKYRVTFKLKIVVHNEITLAGEAVFWIFGQKIDRKILGT